jgi:hypothetical protein
LRNLLPTGATSRLPLRLPERLGAGVPDRRAAGRRLDHRLLSFLWVEKPFRGIEQFGTGVVEGVAAPEGANNSETGGALVPLLTLGIPGSGTTAILLAALILWGYKPGPLLIEESPALFWGLVASMYIGNLMLLVLNLPLVPLFAQLLKLPAYAMYTLILGVSIVGVLTLSGSLFDAALLTVFGLLGYLMRKLDYPAAPLVLGLVLGDPMERALRQSLMMSQGDLSILATRPISGTLPDPGGDRAGAAAVPADECNASAGHRARRLTAATMRSFSIMPDRKILPHRRSVGVALRPRAGGVHADQDHRYRRAHRTGRR